MCKWQIWGLIQKEELLLKLTTSKLKLFFLSKICYYSDFSGAKMFYFRLSLNTGGSKGDRVERTLFRFQSVQTGIFSATGKTSEYGQIYFLCYRDTPPVTLPALGPSKQSLLNSNDPVLLRLYEMQEKSLFDSYLEHQESEGR